MGDLAGMLGNIGGDVMGGLGGIGQAFQGGMNALSTGIGDIGSFLNPGTVNAAGSALTNATSAGDMGVNAVANVADAAAPTATAAAPLSAASVLGGPGVDLSSINPQATLSGIGGVAPSMTTLDPATGMVTAAPTLSDASLATSMAFNPVTGINQGVAADVGQGVQTVPGLPGGSNFLQTLLKNKNALGALGGLGANLISGGFRTPAEVAQMKAMEQQQANFAKNQGALAQGEQSGLLPAGFQNMFQRMLTANEAAIRANYAERGLTGSTAEMRDLQAAREDVQAQVAQLGQNLAQGAWKNYEEGTKYQSDLLNSIYKAETDQRTALGQILSKFAQASTDAIPPSA